VILFLLPLLLLLFPFASVHLYLEILNQTLSDHSDFTPEFNCVESEFAESCLLLHWYQTRFTLFAHDSRPQSVKYLGEGGDYSRDRINSLPGLDRLGGANNTVNPYKPGPQLHYLVAQMEESEKKVLEVVHKLSEKMDDYNKRLMSLSSGVSKVQS
jgi:hypothetical protein